MPTPPHTRPLLALVALALAACSPAIETEDRGPGGDGPSSTDAADATRDATPPADGALWDTAGADSATAIDAGAADRAEADNAAFADAAFVDAAVVDVADSDSDADSDGGTATLWCTAPSPALVGLSAQELHDLLPVKDFMLINVADSTGSQIPGTDTFIDYRDVDGLAAYLGTDLETKVVLYCQSGNRSSQAGNALVGRGYCAVRHLLGGRTAWAAAGYAFE